MKKKMKILVTGSSGFLGSHLIDFLKKDGYEVVLFDSIPSKYNTDKDAEFVGDILDSKIVKKALKGCKAVFHFAALADIDDCKNNPFKSIETNVLGTLVLIEECLKLKINRFIFSSSMYVYSDRGSFYKTSKIACESLIQEYQKKSSLKPTILRFGSLYGPRANDANLISKFISNALINSKIKFDSDGEELREYIHIFDAVRLSIKSLSRNYIGKDLIITGIQKTRVKEIIYIISEIIDKKISITFKKANSGDHYSLTPYKYSNPFADKLTADKHIDLGQGILHLIKELDVK